MENAFEKQGIEFKTITNDMIPSVTDFLWDHFFPDEPIGRSLGFTRSWFIDEFYLADAMKDGSSIAALDKDGNIIGARIGMRKMRSKWMSWIFDRMAFYLPSFLMPKGMPTMMKLINLLEFDVWKMFDQLGCDLIYEDKAVCSARTSGVKGLGTELCKRSESLAKELGCTHTYALVTGSTSI